MIQIAFANQSVEVPNDYAAVVCEALQRQLDEDFAKYHGKSATMHYYPKGTSPPVDMWWALILDTADQANALGYHELNPSGLPLMKIFAKTTHEAGGFWSVTASHEILETVADADCNLGAVVQLNGWPNPKIAAYEICDPVEADEFGYRKLGVAGKFDVMVSNFVTPAYFQNNPASGSVFDFCKQLTAPLQLKPGGYQSYLDPANLSAGWVQQQGRQGQVLNRCSRRDLRHIHPANKRITR